MRNSVPQSKLLPRLSEAGDLYHIGDVYEKSQVRIQLSSKSTNEEATPTPYLEYIDLLTDNGWPQLRYLADWMRVTTAPQLWKHLQKRDTDERASRMNVTLLEFRTDGNTRHDITTTQHLADLLPSLSMHDKDVAARLFVVEDLSRDVIETLGSHFDIDPTFFRGHISDYTWYNTRDPWIELPTMNIVWRKQAFHHVRYAQARYFRDPESYERARLQTGSFNVIRRVDSDGNWLPGIDVPGSDVGILRSKMSFWIQPKNTGVVTGIVLVDPSITEGFPLWGGYNSFVPCPSMADLPLHRPAGNSTSESTLYWLEQMTTEEVEAIARNPWILYHKLLCIVCSEWLTLVRYASTRLSQLEWEVEDPYLRRRYDDLSVTLDKIHTWRRRLPIYKNFISDTLNKVIRRAMPVHTIEDSLTVLEKDYENILTELNDLHDRTERIMSVVTAVMSIEESKKGFQQDRSLARLTYLAVTFVPLSFISSFFSMTDDVTRLGQTFWIYFIVAIPVTLLALITVWFSDDVVRIWRWFVGISKREGRSQSTRVPEPQGKFRGGGARQEAWTT
ncbi:MAG: hypothetical protein Q9170_004150 [Blastenia crenularia]